jgi:acetoacetyl-CoA synthetase
MTDQFATSASVRRGGRLGEGPIASDGRVVRTRGDILWSPPSPGHGDSPLDRYVAWLARHRGLEFNDFPALWEWSTREIEQFWESIWDHFQVGQARHHTVLPERRMPGADWFPGATLNYAEEVLTRAPEHVPALISVTESGETVEFSTRQLADQVGALARTLRELGVRPGDRVAAFVPNIAEAVVALLATASLGAVWTACAPDFGTQAIIDRFHQVEPVVLVAVAGYEFGGRHHDRTDVLNDLVAALPTVRRVILIPSREEDMQATSAVGPVMTWAEATAQPAAPAFETVPFGHPLWILYSSGTTGRPKGIVHSHGGMVLDHLKGLALGTGVGPGDRYFFYSSTSWMVWNLLVSVLLTGATAVLYAGSPVYPDVLGSWRVASLAGASVFGTGAAYLTGCERAGVAPAEAVDLSALRTIVSTGSPLPTGTWSWVYERLGPDVRLDSSTGGTDVCSGFIGGSPWLPVYLGELSGPALGAKVEAYDDAGRSVVGELGELVLTEPMPSMPTHLWNDPDGSRYRDAYFSQFPGVWRHGDWIEFTERGTVVVRGRSDATLNRGGVRLGSADLYAVVDPIPGVSDSLVLGLELPDGGYYMPLFVVPAEGADRAALEREIRATIASGLSRRHVPDEIVFAPGVPHTLTGKKLEVPIKRLLMGTLHDGAITASAITSAESLDWYRRFGEDRVRPLLR